MCCGTQVWFCAQVNSRAISAFHEEKVPSQNFIGTAATQKHQWDWGHWCLGEGFFNCNTEKNSGEVVAIGQCSPENEQHTHNKSWRKYFWPVVCTASFFFLRYELPSCHRFDYFMFRYGICFVDLWQLKVAHWHPLRCLTEMRIPSQKQISYKFGCSIHTIWADSIPWFHGSAVTLTF